MNDLKKLSDAITNALRTCPTADVLSVLTGSFVSLTLELVCRSGNDVDKEIKIDGGKQRDVTIHAPKSIAAIASKKATVVRKCNIADVECKSQCSPSKCKNGKDGVYIGPQTEQPEGDSMNSVDRLNKLSRSLATAITATGAKPAQTEPNELIWCGCGDGYPADSFEAGVMAVAGQCSNCVASKPLAKEGFSGKS